MKEYTTSVRIKAHVRLGDGAVRAVPQRGPLSPMILKSVGDRQPEIDSFSAALKGRAERR
jgi:hypothetical protein